jgi:hypothetical protein
MSLETEGALNEIPTSASDAACQPAKNIRINKCFLMSYMFITSSATVLFGKLIRKC